MQLSRPSTPSVVALFGEVVQFRLFAHARRLEKVRELDSHAQSLAIRIGHFERLLQFAGAVRRNARRAGRKEINLKGLKNANVQMDSPLVDLLSVRPL